MALERHPAARGAACRRALSGSGIAAPPPPPSPFPSPGAQGPTQQLRPQNGCRQLRHVTPLCLSGSRTPWDPGTSGRGRRVASQEAPPGRGGWGSRPGETGQRPGRRLRVGGGEKMAAILCGFAAPPPPQAAEGAGPGGGSDRGVNTYRLLFLLHSGGHLRHGPVYRGVFVQVGQILTAENRQRLRGV